MFNGHKTEIQRTDRRFSVEKSSDEDAVDEQTEIQHSADLRRRFSVQLDVRLRFSTRMNIDSADGRLRGSSWKTRISFIQPETKIQRSVDFD